MIKLTLPRTKTVAALIGLTSMMGVAAAEAEFSPEGAWLTGDESAIVGIGPCDETSNTLCGVIVGLPGAKSDPVMQVNAVELCEAPVVWDLKPSSKGDKWVEGKILDFETSKTYGAQLKGKNGDLIVRAYQGSPTFGENLTWTRVEDFEPC